MKYAELLDMEHFHAKDKKYMSINDRAAQFAAYKALDGHEDLIIDKTKQVLGATWEEIDYYDRQDSLEF